MLLLPLSNISFHPPTRDQLILESLVIRVVLVETPLLHLLDKLFERAREQDEMAALDAVRDYEADPTETLEDVPQDIVFKTLKVSCACVPVLVFACVCCVRARRRYVFVRICICIF